VRLSHSARGFLARPNQHFVRLISVFKLFTSMAEMLPEAMIVILLEPMLSPVYRCMSAMTAHAKGAGARNSDSISLPDVQTLEEALNLRPYLRLQYLGQLAQACHDALSAKLQAGGQGAAFTLTLTKIRTAVERARADRMQQRKIRPVVDPQGAALEKKQRSLKKKASKKRKMEEHLLTTKGGRGKTRVKKSQVA